MWQFIFGVFCGSVTGVIFMCLFQINRSEGGDDE